MEESDKYELGNNLIRWFTRRYWDAAGFSNRASTEAYRCSFGINLIRWFY